MKCERARMLEELVVEGHREENKCSAKELLIELKAAGMRARYAADERWWSKNDAGLWEEDAPKIVVWNRESGEYEGDLVMIELLKREELMRRLWTGIKSIRDNVGGEGREVDLG